MATFWWKKQERVHETLFSVVRHLANLQRERRERNIRCMRLHGDFDLAAAGLSLQGVVRNLAVGNQVGLTLNVIESMSDTVTQKITKNKPKPMFLTSGGDPSMQKRAKQLNKFAEGVFYATKFPRIARELMSDSTVFDISFIHVYGQDGKIVAERVFSNEILWDDAEAVFAQPRAKYRIKAISREVLLARYPKLAAQIRLAKAVEDQYVMHANLADMIPVVEGWHLPSFDGAKDGRHVIALENVTLLDESYKRSYFPFIPFRWKKRKIGYGGRSLADSLTGLQYEINKTLRTIQLSLHLLGIPKVFVENGSRVIRSHLNNEIGGIIEFEGKEPTVKVFQVVPPQLMEHLNWLYQRAYEREGVSALSSQSKKPAGLDSGKALREYNDIESERFITVGEDYEDVHLEFTRHSIDIAKELNESEGEFSVNVPTKRYGQKFLETIHWDEVELDEDEYMMQCFPVSALSSHPSGRLQDVQEYTQAGFLTKEQASMLLDFPDVEGVMSLNTAAIEDIQFAIEQLLEGDFVNPEPYQKLDMGIQMVQSAYLRAKTNGVEEEKLELMRRWMEAADALIQKAKSASGQGQPPATTTAGPGAMAGAGGPMDGTPTAVPAAPPVSPLLPNVPGAQ
jgi:hypothetical protein